MGPWSVGRRRAASAHREWSGPPAIASPRRPAPLTGLAATYGNRVLPLVLDLTDADQAQRAVDNAVATFECVDITVNNAGYADLVAIEDIDLDDFRAHDTTVDAVGIVHDVASRLRAEDNRWADLGRSVDYAAS